MSRTLVYGTLTVMLALVYLGLVIGGQHLLVSLLRQSNGVVLVGSTLIVAALFQPLRRRMESHHLSSLASSPEGTEGVALHGIRWFPWCAGGRSYSETCTGCIVSSTMPSNCSLNCSKSTSLRKVTLKAASVLAASYLRR